MSGRQGRRVAVAVLLGVMALVAVAGAAPAATRWDFSLFVGIVLAGACLVASGASGHVEGGASTKL